MPPELLLELGAVTYIAAPHHIIGINNGGHTADVKITWELVQENAAGQRRKKIVELLAYQCIVQSNQQAST